MYGLVYNTSRVNKMASVQKHSSCNFQSGLLLLAVILHQPGLTAAEIYKWTDDRGRIHYGDRPEGDQAKQIEVGNNPAPDKSLNQRVSDQQHLLEIMAAERQQQKQTEADEKKSLEKRLANCKTAENMLAAMQTSRYLYEETSDPYNPKILTAAESNTAFAKAKNDVIVWCKKPPKP